MYSTSSTCANYLWCVVCRLREAVLQVLMSAIIIVLVRRAGVLIAYGITKRNSTGTIYIGLRANHHKK